MCLVLTYDYFSGVIISQWDEVFNTDLGICSNTLSGLEVRVRAGRPFGPCWMLFYCCYLRWSISSYRVPECRPVTALGVGDQLRVGHL